MGDQSKLNLFNFLIFVSLIRWIRGELRDVNELTRGTVSDNNDGVTVSLLNISVDQIYNKKFISYELSEKEIKAAEGDDKFTRRTRDIEPVSLYSKYFEARIISTTPKSSLPYLTTTLDCYFCSASGISRVHDPCYEGGR